MDRKLFKRSFNENTVPRWVCPTCNKGNLQLQNGAIHQGERLHTRDHSHDDFDPEWIELVYSCMFVCSNSLCREFIASSGTGGVDRDHWYDENGEVDSAYQEYFRPLFFEPPLNIITVPTGCPQLVSAPLIESFRVVFSAPSAAANLIRIAIEKILDDLKVKRFKVKDGKRRFVPLHERITLMPMQYSELREMVLAVKWLGNSGSHENATLTIDDALDAYELTEQILKEIYEPKPKHLKALAKKVNKKKGPIKQ
jgi:hypothetical protein